MGLGAALFVPAASVPSLPLFLAALIIVAAGITGLQVAANPYGDELRRAARLPGRTSVVGQAVSHHLYARYRRNGAGIHHAFILPVICYLYVLFFAAKGQPRRAASYAR